MMRMCWSWRRKWTVLRLTHRLANRKMAWQRAYWWRRTQRNSRLPRRVLSRDGVICWALLHWLSIDWLIKWLVEYMRCTDWLIDCIDACIHRFFLGFWRLFFLKTNFSIVLLVPTKPSDEEGIPAPLPINSAHTPTGTVHVFVELFSRLPYLTRWYYWSEEIFLPFIFALADADTSESGSSATEPAQAETRRLLHPFTETGNCIAPSSVFSFVEIDKIVFCLTFFHMAPNNLSVFPFFFLGAVGSSGKDVSLPSATEAAKKSSAAQLPKGMSMF